MSVMRPSSVTTVVLGDGLGSTQSTSVAFVIMVRMLEISVRYTRPRTRDNTSRSHRTACGSALLLVLRDLRGESHFFNDCTTRDTKGHQGNRLTRDRLPLSQFALSLMTDLLRLHTRILRDL